MERPVCFIHKDDTKKQVSEKVRKTLVANNLSDKVQIYHGCENGNSGMNYTDFLKYTSKFVILIIEDW